MNRTQHIISSGLVAFVGLWVCGISYTQQPAEAFLFPRLISSVFVALALWTFGKAIMGWSKVVMACRHGRLCKCCRACWSLSSMFSGPPRGWGFTPQPVSAFLYSCPFTIRPRTPSPEAGSNASLSRASSWSLSTGSSPNFSKFTHQERSFFKP